MNNDDKRKSFEENNLKPGQRFIDDREIDKLFNLFRELRKINKDRNCHFINMQELKEIKEAQNERSYFNNKSGENFFKNNNSSNSFFGCLEKIFLQGNFYFVYLHFQNSV